MENYPLIFFSSTIELLLSIEISLETVERERWQRMRAEHDGEKTILFAGAKLRENFRISQVKIFRWQSDLGNVYR